MRVLHLAAAGLLLGLLASFFVETALWAPPRIRVIAPPATRHSAGPGLDRGRLATLLHLEPRAVAPAPAPPLPLTLLGTLEPTFACVVDRATGRAQTLAVGDVLAGVELVSVGRGVAWVRRGDAVEPLAGASAGVDVAPPPAPSPASAAARVAKHELARALEDFPTVARGVHVVPRFEAGVFQGFKLYGASKVPLLQRAGLKDGDVIRRINGVETSRPDQLLALFGQLPGMSLVQLDLIRDGAAVHHAITLE